MRSPRILVLLALSVCLLGAPASGAEGKASHNHKRVLTHVLPDRSDLAWTKVPWRATLWDAVIEAQTEKKPILLWAMNGHVLGCT